MKARNIIGDFLQEYYTIGIMQSLADPIRCYYDCYDYYDDVRGNVVCSADPLGKLREPHLVYCITEEDWGGGC